jgi:hypothetical protein
VAEGLGDQLIERDSACASVKEQAAVERARLLEKLSASEGLLQASVADARKTRNTEKELRRSSMEEHWAAAAALHRQSFAAQPSRLNCTYRAHPVRADDAFGELVQVRVRESVQGQGPRLSGQLPSEAARIKGVLPDGTGRNALWSFTSDVTSASSS